jgi:hypothetical protein
MPFSTEASCDFLRPDFSQHLVAWKKTPKY